MTLSLSVLIPTYARPAALERTLAALAAQETDASFEVVICDDGSPAEAAERIDSIAAAAPAQAESRGRAMPVRVIRQENAGPAAARNAAAREAAAELLLFLDDDCAPAPDLVARHASRHAAALTGDQPISLLGHVAWAPEVRVTPFMELVVRGAQFNYGAIADPERVPFTCFYTANCSLRRKTLEAAGWFDAALPPYMEDTEFGYRLVQSGARIVYDREARVFHEHAVELKPYLERQRKAGRAAVQVVERHPELFDLVGVADVADVGLREQFYSALLRYAFVVGVEEGLQEQVQEGAITGAELQGQFEGWLAHWAVHRASETRAWRARAEALKGEIARRDTRLAEVVQQKDAEIASLQAQLARFNDLPPVRLAQWLKRRVAR